MSKSLDDAIDREYWMRRRDEAHSMWLPGDEFVPVVSPIHSDQMRQKAVTVPAYWVLTIDDDAGLDGGTADLPVLVAAAVAIGGTE